MDGVFFDLRKSAILHLWPTPNPLYSTSDLQASVVLQLLYGLVAAAPGPLAAVLAAALGQDIVLT